MKKQKIKLGVVKVYVNDLDGQLFEASSDVFSQAKKELLASHPDTEEIKFDVEYYDDGATELYVVAFRFETEEEVLKREASAKLAAEYTRDRELAELARLKAKYEGV